MVSRKERKWLLSAIALAKTFSTCAKRQYFAVILSPNGRVLSVGYNGSPPGMPHCDEGHCPRFNEQSASGSNYDNCIAQHAEINAIIWADVSLRNGATLIVNGPPCFGCAKAIASSGITRVVCISDVSYQQWPEIQQFLNCCEIVTETVTYGELYETRNT